MIVATCKKQVATIISRRSKSLALKIEILGERGWPAAGNMEETLKAYPFVITCGTELEAWPMYLIYWAMCRR
ncbi:hypothetical protein SPSPH_008930 [Sporomusa sphaeroides DSM 2875]|uniref:Uncharacterized protein n=1 Tax=Sporomusa sphaeroides DSM 2875 TaxID=1337886 RepID=A0ABM9W1H9_9FIRM|nr:hypothetical protein SPSPH_08610 [Sporomusa sphaeroides DSM 2875]CVK18090.1 hypothetical protein SSPH_00727 [Sporomusa sphaeroides DSM 2875]